MIMSYKVTVNFCSILVIIQKDRNYDVIGDKIRFVTISSEFRDTVAKLLLLA